MQSACDSQPDASQGQTIVLQRKLFDIATVGTATTSSATTSSTSSATTSSTSSAKTTSESTAATTASTSTSTPDPTTTPTSTSVAAPAQTSSSSSGLSSGAAAGIGIGCGLAAIALAAGLGWFFLKRRRQPHHAPPVHEDLPYNDSKSAFVSVSSYQPPPQYAQPPYAQQLASREVHEMDTRQSRNMTNELDGRPVH